MAELYRRLDIWWPGNSIGFDDVCLSYKDRPYVTQRPNDNIHFYSLYRGSAMGGAFGAALGARLAPGNKNVFLFTGDGCFRLFSGSLAEACGAGLIVFLLNNSSLSIVSQGLPIILPTVDTRRYHGDIKSIEYCEVAKACGWRAVQVSTDLEGLEAELDRALSNPQQSTLFELCVDPDQVLGLNPRVYNL